MNPFRRKKDTQVDAIKEEAKKTRKRLDLAEKRLLAELQSIRKEFDLNKKGTK